MNRNLIFFSDQQCFQLELDRTCAIVYAPEIPPPEQQPARQMLLLINTIQTIQKSTQTQKRHYSPAHALLWLWASDVGGWSCLQRAHVSKSRLETRPCLQHSSQPHFSQQRTETLGGFVVPSTRVAGICGILMHIFAQHRKKDRHGQPAVRQRCARYVIGSVANTSECP